MSETVDLIPFPPGLELFCGLHGKRRELHEPFRLNGVAYATDGKILAFVDNPGPDSFEPVRYGAFLAVANEALVPFTHTLDEFLTEPITYQCHECEGAKVLDLDCLTCEGSGYHECDTCSHEHECGDCDGKGTDAERGTELCSDCAGTGEQFHRVVRGQPHRIAGRYLNLILPPEHTAVRFCGLKAERAAFSFTRDGLLWRGLVAYTRE